MKRKSSKFLSLLLAAVLLLSLIAPAALAAGTADTIYLRTAEDLAGFSQNCTPGQLVSGEKPSIWRRTLI